MNQRAEAKKAMLRLFRYRARKGIGVFYSLISLLFLLDLTIFSSRVSLYEGVAGIVAAAAVIWYVARLAGLHGLDQMEYSLDFLEGGQELALRRKGALHSRTFFRVLAFASILGYTVARLERVPLLAHAFLIAWFAEIVLYQVFLLSTGGNRIFDRRVEDWVVLATVFVLPFTRFIAPHWGFFIVVPIYLFSGLKSLRESSKELAHDGL
jgi:hypothetical protein